MPRYCKKCSRLETINEPLDEHHIIPKYIGGKDMDGRIEICKHEHIKLHELIDPIIRKLTEWWLKQ